MAIKRAVTEVKRKPMPCDTDEEAFLRLGVPDGLATDGDYNKHCYSKFVREGEEIPHNPMTAKGKKIMAAMMSEYGEKKGKKVFYASKNKGTIKGVERKH